MHRVSTALAIALLAFAPAARAATLTAVPDAYYANGYYWAVWGAETTITITGDSEGAAASFIEGALQWDGSLSTTLSATQTPHTSSGGSVQWAQGQLYLQDGSAYVFNQYVGTPLTVDQLQIATLTLRFETVGVSNFYWGSETEFFGLTSDDLPSPAFTIACCLDEPIPEPATGALLALGLLALAWRPRASR